MSQEQKHSCAHHFPLNVWLDYLIKLYYADPPSDDQSKSDSVVFIWWLGDYGGIRSFGFILEDWQAGEINSRFIMTNVHHIIFFNSQNIDSTHIFLKAAMFFFLASQERHRRHPKQKTDTIYRHDYKRNPFIVLTGVGYRSVPSPSSIYCLWKWWE